MTSKVAFFARGRSQLRVEARYPCEVVFMVRQPKAQSFILFGEELMTSNWLVRSPFADEVLRTPIEA
jgi:hypothetical protein